MRIISWNCCLAFRNKAAAIIAYTPDIVVLQESEQIDRITKSPFYSAVTDSVWLGDNPSKGLGIISFSSYRFKLLSAHSDDFKYVAPIHVSGPMEFTLIAVWARHDKYLTYNGVIKFALKHYIDILLDPCMVIGDWNANAIWDSQTGEGFSFNAGVLAAHGMSSAYHSWFAEAYGHETRPTHYHRKNKGAGFHIDYCHLSPQLRGKLRSVSVGSFDDWHRLSDHVPFIVDLD